MFDFLFALGQAAWSLFLIFVGVLVLLPAKKTRQAKQDEMRLMHLRMHA